MRKLLLVLAVLVAFLILFQTLILDKLPEKVEEDKYSDLSNIPVTSALPQYLGSLFLGAFRAVAIDVLWINYDDAKQDRRYYEAKEIIELISYLQPRNEAVWDFLAWDVAYNIAYGERHSTEDEWWRWIRYGFLKMKEGADANKKSPYLRYMLGFMLDHKASWEGGRFQMDYITAFEKDLELQAKLIGKKVDKPLSPFEFAIEWYKEAKDVLAEYRKRTGRRYYAFKGGVAVHSLTLDIYIKECFYYQAMLCWQRGDFRGATTWLDKALEHANYILKQYGEDGVSPIHRRYPNFFSRLREILPAAEAADKKETLLADKANVLSLLEQLLKDFATFDNFYVHTFVSDMKKSLGGDEYEFNDATYCAIGLTRDRVIYSTIAPMRLDVDYYSIYVASPEKGSGEKFIPKNVRFAVDREGGIDIAVSVYNQINEKAVYKSFNNENSIMLSFKAEVPGLYYIKVEMAGNDGKWSPQDKYSLQLIEIK